MQRYRNRFLNWKTERFSFLFIIVLPWIFTQGYSIGKYFVIVSVASITIIVHTLGRLGTITEIVHFYSTLLGEW